MLHFVLRVRYCVGAIYPDFLDGDLLCCCYHQHDDRMRSTRKIGQMYVRCVSRSKVEAVHGMVFWNVTIQTRITNWGLCLNGEF